MFDAWAKATGHATYAKSISSHSINEFSKPSSIKKALKRAVYIDGDPLADQISYCYAHCIKSYQASTPLAEFGS
jgi:hypothetical protein